jgi:hypothetical protein
MNKKSRFNMLEVEPGEKKPREKKTAKKVEKSLQQGKRDESPAYKVIIEDDDFKNNLKKHKLKAQKKEIEKQKIEIAEQIQTIKKHAYLKITIGAFFTLLGLYKLIIGTSTRSIRHLGGDEDELIIAKFNTVLSQNNYIQILLIVTGLYLVFSNKKDTKDTKK